MEFQRDVPIKKIVNLADVVVVYLNFNEENFENCFSKMEFTMGMDYMSWAVNQFNLPVIYTEKVGEATSVKDLMDYRKVKIFNRSAHTAPKSSLDDKFRKEFKNHLPDSSSRVIKVTKEDAFFNSPLREEIEKLGKHTVMLGGFFTEVDVYITALQALMNDFFSVVISDTTSTYSERMFFNSLDIISQVVEVIDTRDLEKIWGVE